MKKWSIIVLAVPLLFFSCEENDDVTMGQSATEIDMSDFYVYTDMDTELFNKENTGKKKNCQSMVVLNRKLKENPGLYQKMYNVEKHTRKTIAAKKPTGTPGGGNGNGNGSGDGDGGNDPGPYTGAVSIPVVINILEDFSGQVTLAQISSQIDILNEDFNNKNPNTSSVPAEFADRVANCNISFGPITINRKISTKSSWGTNDSMKDPNQGGIAVTDPSSNLNIWVCNIGGGILGYAQFPGDPDVAGDGIVIGIDYFGETSGPYGDGRTATHEVGHWLNLRHIWGDGRCKQDDFVADTPSSDRSNGGCPSYPTVHCRTIDMTMNYMDYVYDDCMYMFTNGQNDRMRALFADGGERVGLVN